MLDGRDAPPDGVEETGWGRPPDAIMVDGQGTTCDVGLRGIDEGIWGWALVSKEKEGHAWP